jgi:hypothetical protein
MMNLIQKGEIGNRNCVHEEIKSKLNMRNACYHYVRIYRLKRAKQFTCPSSSSSSSSSGHKDQ